MASKSDRFKCPNCGCILIKSDIARFLGESAGYIALGTAPVTCPRCGRPIDAQKMIDGAYDVGGGPLDTFLGLIAVLWMFGGPFLLSLKFDVPLLWAILAPWGSLLVLALLVAGLLKLFRK